MQSRLSTGINNQAAFIATSLILHALTSSMNATKAPRNSPAFPVAEAPLKAPFDRSQTAEITLRSAFDLASARTWAGKG